MYFVDVFGCLGFDEVWRLVGFVYVFWYEYVECLDIGVELFFGFFCYDLDCFVMGYIRVILGCVGVNFVVYIGDIVYICYGFFVVYMF